MAEATLKDVIEEIRAQGEFTRMGTHGSLQVAIGELRGIKSNIQILSENFKLAFYDLIVAQKKALGIQLNQEEELRDTANQLAAQQALGGKDPDPDTQPKAKTTVNDLLESFKKMIPKKSPGLFALLFGGLAAALAFIPDWVKKNIIDPVADMFGVMGGKDAETTLGKITGGVGKVIQWLEDNIHPDADWIVGALAASAILTPSLLKSFASFTGTVLRFAGAHPLFLAAGLAIAGLIKLMNFFRDKSIKTETERVEELQRRYDEAAKIEDPTKRLEALKAIAKEAQNFQDRIKDTAISNIESINGPLNTILGHYKKINDAQLEVTAAEAIAAANRAKQLEEEAKIQKEDDRRAILEAKAAQARVEAAQMLFQLEEQTQMKIKNLLSNVKSSEELEAQSKNILQDIIEKSSAFQDEESKTRFLAGQMQRLEETINSKLRDPNLIKRGTSVANINTLKAQLAGAMDAAPTDIIPLLQQIQRELGPTQFDIGDAITQSNQKAAEEAKKEQINLQRLLNEKGLMTRKYGNIEVAPEFGLPKDFMAPEMQEYMRVRPQETSGTNVNNVSPVDARSTSNDNRQTNNFHNTTINNFHPKVANGAGSFV